MRNFLYLLLSVIFMTMIVCIVMIVCMLVCPRSNDNGDSVVGYFNEDHSKVTIDFGDKFYKQDTFDCHEFIGENYVGSDILSISIKPDGDKIVKAEKDICYYPTLWSAPEDDAIQFVYLFDLCYNYTKVLKVKDGYLLSDILRRGT